MRLHLVRIFRCAGAPFASRFIGNPKHERGFTLVEVVVTAVLASYLMLALVWFYTFGIELISSSLSLNLMYGEGMATIHGIEKMMRNADQMDVPDDLGSNRISIHVPDWAGDGSTGGNVEYYYNSRDKSLRLNDGRVDKNLFNVRLMPTTYRSGRRGRVSNAYTLKDVEFKPARDLVDNIIDPSYNIMRVTLVMENDRGDSLTLTGIGSNMNVIEGD